MLSALCYSELGAMLPVSGSAYSFASATLGQLVGWMIGWDLMLEYLMGAATVAVGWSGYLSSIMRDLGAPLPAALSQAPYHRTSSGEWAATGGVVNLPAALVVGGVTLLLAQGVRESARFNNAVVLVKLFVLLLFLACGWGYVDARLWSPYVPPAQGAAFGAWGVLRGSSVVFFAFIGADAITTAAGEAKNPQRDIPIATLLSLGACTALYIGVSAVVTGLVSYKSLDVPDPIAVALDAVPALGWLRPVIKLGALLGLTSVVMVLLQGQSRIFWAMAEDGLLPRAFAALHPLTRAPVLATQVTGAAAALTAALLPVDVLGEMVSIGTLAAFAVVCGGVLALRRSHPALPRPFRVPYSPYVPALGVATSALQMLALPQETWARLAVWMALGLAVYHFYSRHHARPMRERLTRMLAGVPGGQQLAEALCSKGGEGGAAAAAPAGAAAEGGSSPLVGAGAAPPG